MPSAITKVLGDELTEPRRRLRELRGSVTVRDGTYGGTRRSPGRATDHM
jgi:hypothetical protein